MNSTTKTYLLFLITIAGLCSCNEQNVFQTEKHTPFGNVVSKMDKNLLFVFQDKNKNFWFSSKTEGVYKYDGKQILQFTTKEGLISNQIINFQEDKYGNIYFETSDGINKYNGNTMVTIKVNDYKNGNTRWLKKDDLWFRGSWSKNEIYRYNGKTLERLSFPKHPLEDEFTKKYPNASFSPYGVYSIYKDRHNHIWFGTSSLGVARYDGKSFNWIYEKGLTELDDGPSLGVRSILEDSEGHFWFNNNMSHRYQIDNKKSTKNQQKLNYKPLKGIDNLEMKPLKNSIMSITEDQYKNIWMVTFDNGVWKYDGKKTSSVPIQQEAENIKLFSIYRDKQDSLWLRTHDQGIYKFNGTSFQKFVPTIKKSDQ